MGRQPGRLSVRSRDLTVRLLCALVAMVSFGVPLWSALGVRVPYRTEQQLANVGPAEPAQAVQIPELTYLRTADGETTYRQRLLARGLPALLRYPEIRLLVANYGNSRNIRTAEISVPAGNCGYVARPGEPFPNNDVVAFTRQQSCLPVSTTSSQEVVISFRLSGPGPIALWTAPTATGQNLPVELLLTTSVGNQHEEHALVGTFGETDYSRAKSRLALLNYVWQISQSSRWVIVLTIGAALLIGLAAFVLSSSSVLYGDPGSQRALYSAFGAFSAALALSVVYACIVPPFQAADEPHHFAGLVSLIGHPELNDEATSLAQLGHVDRIKFHSTQQFNPSDLGRPGKILAPGRDPEGDVRGRGVFAVWHVFAPLLREHSVGATLLLTRVLNGTVFATAIGLLVYLTGIFSPNRWPILDAFPLFIVPTLPFFGMQVSNYAPLCAAYIIIAAAVLILVWDGPRSWAAGPVLGMGWGAAILLSRNALPLAPLVLACALARLALHRRGRRDAPMQVVTFWLGLSVPCAFAIAALPRVLLDVAAGAIATSPTTLHAIRGVTALPWILVGASVAAVIVELTARASDDTRSAALDQFVAFLARAGALLVVLSITLSIFVSYPSAPPADQPHLSAPGRYVAEILLAGLTMFRFSHPDFMTSSSFWSGFGWLDTFLPEWMVTGLAVSTGVALVLTLLWIARARAARVGGYFLAVIGGLVAAFAVAALGVIRALLENLHGRYLLGIYICLLSLCWHFLPRISAAVAPRSRGMLLAASGLVCAAIHTFAIVTILNRYFG